MVTVQMVKDWEKILQTLHERIGERFARSEPRQRAYNYLKGILSDVGRKNGWQLAEQAGEERPYGMQRLLRSAAWDEEGVRDDLREYVVEELGTEQAVLVLDDTGFVKKGEHSVGVSRQYSGTPGGIDNCQVGVFLAYSTPGGHALIDRALYVPKAWLEDKARSQEAHLPSDLAYTKKTQLGRTLLERALAAKVPHNWVVADALYGDDRKLREWLQAQRQWYVLGITRNHMLAYEGYRQRFDEIAASLPPSAWQSLSCGEGTKGERLYEWAMVSWRNWNYGEDELHAFLVRRNLLDPTDEAYFRVFAPAGTSMQTLVEVVGRRWTVEECFELAKGEVGLDHYEVRTWRAWYRFITLAMLAFAFLAVIRHSVQQLDAEKKMRLRCLFGFPCLRSAAYCLGCCGWSNPLFDASWLGPAGAERINWQPNALTFVVNSAFSAHSSALRYVTL